MKTHTKEHTPAEQRMNIEEKLKNVYFFTDQQLVDVFHTMSEQKIHTFDQIIHDVESQYRNISFETPISDYLYQTLMSIQDVNLKVRQQNIEYDVHAILDGWNSKLISYRDFVPHNSFTDEKVRSTMNQYVTHAIKDFFVIHIDENFKMKKSTTISLKLIQQYLPRSRGMGINFYVFTEKDNTRKIAIGVQKGTTGESNDSYFTQLAQKYHATKVDIPLSYFS